VHPKQQPSVALLQMRCPFQVAGLLCRLMTMKSKGKSVVTLLMLMLLVAGIHKHSSGSQRSTSTTWWVESCCYLHYLHELALLQQ
jgi:hypothetical protein